MSPDLDDDEDAEAMAAAAVALRQQVGELLVDADPYVGLMALIAALGGIAMQAAVDRDDAHEFADSVAKDLHDFFDKCFDEGAEQLRSGLN